MKNIFSHLQPCWLAVVALAMLSGCAAPPSSAATSPTLKEFTLQDQLGRAWSDELVTYAVPADLYGRDDVALVGPEEKNLPHQWTTDENGQKAIAFLADVPKFEISTYHLQNGAAVKTTDLKIEESADTVRLSNAKTGIAIRKKLAAGQAPIDGVLLASGQWMGTSQLHSAKAVTEYSANIIARGPVFSEVLCETKFEGGQSWRMRFRLIAGEPVVLVSEAYALDAESFWTLNLSEKFAPEHLLHRLGRGSASGRVGVVNSWKIGEDAEPAFVLEPWLRWWMRDRQGLWFGLYNDQSNDLLAMGALRPAQWVDPDKKNWSNRDLKVTREKGVLQAKLPLQDGTRHWMLAALDKSQSLQGVNAENPADKIVAPLPQQLVIKYGDFPLDMVKEYSLAWKSDKIERPRLLITQDELARWKKEFQPDEKKLAQLMKTPISAFNAEGPVQYYLATGDENLGRRLADFALSKMQELTDGYFEQKHQVTLGFAPHHNRYIQTYINVADAAWNAMTLDEQTRFQAQLAFLGYTFARDDYWSPERNYAANPNMTSMVAGYQAQTGLMLPDHPQSKAWTDEGFTELKHELDEWSDTEGGWLEAPAYAIASWDFLLGMFLQARNAGIPQGEYLYAPRMKKVADWLAMISTPPDSRVGGIRHLPPIGNTYAGQPTGEFGIMAYLWKDKDPEFSARMQWMHEQHGNFLDAGIGGFSPSLEGYREILMDAKIPAKKPDYGSTLFPETGVLLRNGVGERETQLHMIAGRNHAHYDDDSGSITLWGKGRIVADDFGYYGLAPAEDASMLDSPLMGSNQEIMKVSTFSTSPHFDYVQGARSGWQRRIAFIKDADMNAPNYFVVRDTLAAPAPSTWRLWLDAEKVEIKDNGALAVGKEDVDTDIVFVQPQNATFKTEAKTRSTYGLDKERKYGKVAVSLTGLIAETKRSDQFMTVIYPRSKTGKPPAVTALAEGKAVKVQHEAGTDYVFLSDEPFTFQQDEIRFEGTSGLVKIRGGKAQLALGDGGKLSAGGQTIEKKAAAAQSANASRNMMKNGNFETGEAPLFTSSVVKVSLHEGNPAPAENAPEGKFAMALSLEEDGLVNRSIILREKFYVNPQKTYRVRMKAYTPKKMWITIGGQVYDEANAQIKKEDGKVWGYSLALRGPTANWQTLETTMGPPGSGAKFIWPPNAIYTTFGMWLSGEQGTLYMDDIEFEPLENQP